MTDDAVGGAIPAGAMEAVREFLRYAVDERDAEKARAFLAAASLASGMDEIPEEWRGGTYAIGAGTIDGDQVWVFVEMAGGAEDEQKLKVPFAPVREDGAWKLDLGKTMEKLMGGMMAEAVGQMASAVGEMMAGVGKTLGEVKDAVGSAISGVLGSETDEGKEEESHRKQTTKNVKKTLPVEKRRGAKKKAVTKTHAKAAKTAKKTSVMKKNKPAKKSKVVNKVPPAKKTKKRK